MKMLTSLVCVAGFLGLLGVQEASAEVVRTHYTANYSYAEPVPERAQVRQRTVVYGSPVMFVAPAVPHFHPVRPAQTISPVTIFVD